MCFYLNLVFIYSLLLKKKYTELMELYFACEYIFVDSLLALDRKINSYLYT